MHIPYRIIDGDGNVVREGLAPVEGGLPGGPLYEYDVRNLPVGTYTVEPGPIRFSVERPGA